MLPYLTQPQVDSPPAVVAARSAGGSRLIATYPTPNRLAGLGRIGMRISSRLTGARDPLAGEPHLSAWDTVSRNIRRRSSHPRQPPARVRPNRPPCRSRRPW